MAAHDAKLASRGKTTYLVLYNFLSAVAWTTVLGRTIALYTLRGPEFVFLGTGEWTRWTQTMAILEVLHAVLGTFPFNSVCTQLLTTVCTGVVRAPITTTLMQVSSRFLLVWFIVYPFPSLAQSPFYSSMLLAWSVTEVIRYSYFALALSGAQPRFLIWLRYNTFFVLYPMGIVSEAALVYMAATGPAAEQIGDWYAYILYGILGIYVPGRYFLSWESLQWYLVTMRLMLTMV